MIESASVAIGSGIGAAFATSAFLLVKLFKRNGRASSGLSTEKVRHELHSRITDEVATAKEDYVRKDVCALVREGLEKDIKAIKSGVETLLERRE